MNTETNKVDNTKFLSSGFGQSLTGEQVIKLHKLSVGWIEDSVASIPISQVGAARLDNLLVGVNHNT